MNIRQDQLDEDRVEDDWAQFQHNQCRELIQRALKYWEHTVISSPEDYMALMRFLVRIDNTLKSACASGDTTRMNLLRQVEMVENESRRLSERVKGARVAYQFTMVRRPLATLFMGGISFYIHSSSEMPVPVHVRTPRWRAVEDIILASYRGISRTHFGVLDNPTFHNLSTEDQAEWSGREGPHPSFMHRAAYLSMKVMDIGCESSEMHSRSHPSHILVGNNPRAHVLMSFELQPQLYSLMKPPQGSGFIFKDARGSLHSCLDIWKRHDVHGELDWKLYRLVTSKEGEINTMALVAVGLPATECHRQVTPTGYLESLWEVWQRIIELDRQPGDDFNISWLIEVCKLSGTIPTSPKYAGEEWAAALTGWWGPISDLCCEYMSPAPLFHSVLGSVHIGSAPHPDQEIAPGNIPDLQYFVKDLSNARIDHPSVQRLGDSRDEIIARFACSICDHPNILPLKAIQPMPWGGIGLVFPQISTKSLSEYLAVAPRADRWNLCLQVSDGLEYLHELGLIHGDLRAANILVSLAGEAMVSDPILLGSNTLNNEPASIRWMAPEVIRGDPPNRASDVYSLGMTILEIITGVAPYFDRSDAEVLETMSSEPPSWLPERPESSIPKYSKHGDDLWGLLLDLWSFNVSDRPIMALVTEIIKSIVPDGLQPPSQQEIDHMLDILRVLTEASYELSEVETMSCFLSDAGASHVNDIDTNTNNPAIARGAPDPESHKVTHEIIRRLALHGCENITDHIPYMEQVRPP